MRFFLFDGKIEHECFYTSDTNCDICDNVFKDFKMDVCGCNLNICFNCVKNIYNIKNNYICPFCRKSYSYSKKSLTENKFINDNIVNLNQEENQGYFDVEVLINPNEQRFYARGLFEHIENVLESIENQNVLDSIQSIEN